MRGLVTGSGGFIGSHLIVELVREGWTVAGLDRDGPGPTAERVSAHYSCDLLDHDGLTEAFTEFRPEVVFHLAARTDLQGSMDSAEQYYAANIEGVRNVVAAIRAARSVQRALCVSTQLVHEVGVMPLDDRALAPRTAYGWSKVRTEEIWRESNGGGTHWLIVRPTTVWGPRMSAHYRQFFELLRRGLYVHVGKKRILKSFGYVENVAFQMRRLAETAAEQIHGRVFYAADYTPLVLQEWVEEFRDALGGPRIRTVPPALAKAGARVGDMLNAAGVTRFPFNTFRLANVCKSYVLDLSETKQVCGVLPVSVEEGVRQTALWVLQQTS